MIYCNGGIKDAPLGGSEGFGLSAHYAHACVLVSKLALAAQKFGQIEPGAKKGSRKSIKLPA
jgi:hypothetical protein